MELKFQQSRPPVALLNPLPHPLMSALHTVPLGGEAHLCYANFRTQENDSCPFFFDVGIFKLYIYKMSIL